MSEKEPIQEWIPFEDLDEEAHNNSVLWKCRTLLNNSSSYSFEERTLQRKPSAASVNTFVARMLFGVLLLFCNNVISSLDSYF